MPGQASKAHQVSRLGETPAEARARMASAGRAAEPGPEGRGEEVEEFTSEHIAAIREADEGFKGTAVSGGTVEEAEDIVEPPTPSKAMDMIRQLSQDKLQLQTERDAALSKVARYEKKYGEID